MFKIIKWSTVICIITLMLSGEIVQAKPPGHKSKPVSNEQKIKRKAKKEISEAAVNKNAKVIAAAIEKTDCKELDQQAGEWLDEGLNWTSLFGFFSSFMTTTEFLMATRGSGYANISALAQTLYNNGTAKTVEAAKFFVYSVLHAFHDECDSNGWDKIEGFDFLLYAKTAVQSYNPVDVKSNGNTLKPGDTKQMLSPYRANFIKNTEITSLELTNNLSDLISLINSRAKIQSPYQELLHAMSTVTRPTVADVMQYYQKEEYEDIFAFLVRHPMEAEEIAKDKKPRRLKAETELRQKVFEVLKQLWDDVQDHGAGASHKQLADIAIHLFGINPLVVALCSVDGLAPQFQAAVVVSQPKPVDTEINWNKFRRSHIAKDSNAAHDIFKGYFVKLTRVLLVDQAVKYLVSHNVLSGDLEEKIKSGATYADKVSLLMDEIIYPALSTGTMDQAKMLLEYMLTSADVDECNIAKNMREDLIASEG